MSKETIRIDVPLKNYAFSMGIECKYKIHVKMYIFEIYTKIIHAIALCMIKKNVVLTRTAPLPVQKLDSSTGNDLRLKIRKFRFGDNLFHSKVKCIKKIR